MSPVAPFGKSVQRLPLPMKRELAAVIDELLAAQGVWTRPVVPHWNQRPTLDRYGSSA